MLTNDQDQPGGMVSFTDAPINRFHIRVVFGGTGGQFADGFSLGIIGITLSLAAGPLNLTSWWMGALGAASLMGLFAGCLMGGPLTDRIGRRPIFAWGMLVFAGLSVAQFWVDSPIHLLILRILLGVVLGADYVVSKSLVTEFAPTRWRGKLLSILAVAWAAGYVCSYVAGYLMRNAGPDAWRWALLSSSIPSFLIFWFRVTMPESPLYLVSKGMRGEAQKVVARYFGPGISLPESPPVEAGAPLASKNLFRLGLQRNLVVGCLFYTCQVIPFFAIGTYLPTIFESLGMHDKYLAGLVFNALLMLGALLGLAIVDLISRRVFLIGSFWLMAALLILLLSLPVGSQLIIIVFAAFAFVLAASVNLEYVYTPELFPTSVRATGIGLVIACSRVGSAFSTFVLPVVVQEYGIMIALGFCALVLMVGAIGCQLWAPETKKAAL